MGQKKVIEKTQEEVLKEEKEMEVAVAKSSAAPKEHSGKVDTGVVYVNFSYNNTILTATNKKGDVVGWITAGSLGFSGPKKATPFAASKMVGAISDKLKKLGFVNIEVVLKGVGSARDSALKSLAAQGFNIVSIKDVTPIPHNGPRPPKVRRV
ncbi:30S ribosomal protein S11 [Candidatus Wolfebacteria bacterium]|nr:30S ribosomal protein S11 [Candidatus Wolfebacteria bacterium]